MSLRLFSLRSFAVMFVVVFSIVSSGCGNPFGPAADGSHETGTSSGSANTGPRTTATLVVTTGTGMTVQTIAPSTDLVGLSERFRLTLENVAPGTYDDIVVDPYVPGTAVTGIEPGDWNVTIDAFSDAAGTVLIAYGAPTVNPVTFAPGENVGVEVQLQPIGTGQGEIEFTIDITAVADAIDFVVVTLDPWPLGGGDEVVLDAGTHYTFDPSGGTAPGFEISYTENSGWYVLKVQFQRDVDGTPVDHAPVIEVVRVYNNLTSAKAIAFAPGDLNSPPAPPTGVVATQTDVTTVWLTWTDASNTEQGFRVYRDGAEIATLGAGIESHADTTFSGGAPHVYDVRSFNAFGESAAAIAPTITPITNLDALAPWVAQTNVALRPRFQWTLASGADQYDLRVFDGGVEVVTEIGIPGGIEMYELTAVQQLDRNVAYTWTVTARNATASIETAPSAFTTRGNTLYVSPAGVDLLQNGAMTTNPVATIAYALNNLAVPGDTIRVASGTYTEVLPPITYDVSIWGSYTPDFSGFSPGEPDTVITNDGTASTYAIRIDAGTTDLYNVIVAAPPHATTSHAVSFAGGLLTMNEVELRVPDTVDTSTQMRVVSVTGNGQVSLQNSFVYIGGDVPATAHGFFLAGTSNVVLTVSNTQFATALNLNVNALEWFGVQGGGGERTIIVEQSGFSGEIAGTGTSAVVNVAAESANTDLHFIDNNVAAIENGNNAVYGVRLLGGIRTTEIARNRLNMATTAPGGSVEAVAVRPAAPGGLSPVVRDNMIRVPGRTDLGSSYGVRTTGTATGAPVIANNVIEVFGAANLASYGIGSATPETLIVNNTLVFAADYGDTGGSRLISLNAAATENVVTNNILVGYTIVPLTALNNAAGDTVDAHANVFSNVSDDVDALNRDFAWNLDPGLWLPNRSGNFVMNPSLNNVAAFGTTAWHASEAPATPPLILAGGSPAHTGIIGEDINGIDRTGDPVSIGAYQVNGQSVIGAAGPAGGVIFYDHAAHATDGWRFLESALTDRGPAAWGGDDTATATGIGTGADNSVLLSAAVDAPAHTAAVGETLGGYADWFLPSLDELSEMHANRAAIGGFGVDAYYWSSSQLDVSQAWQVFFNATGDAVGATKPLAVAVRAARRF